MLGILLLCNGCAGTGIDKGFYLGNGTPPDGYTAVPAVVRYTDIQGYGWLGGQANRFAVHLPEGNYEVVVTFASPEAAMAATVKAEARRLMLKRGGAADGVVRRFAVNVRRPEIEGGGSVRLTSREQRPLIAHWDELLTIEFLPDAHDVVSIRILPAPDAVTVYVAGDSTVTDQRSEPWCGWGQLLPSFFGPGVAVANHAESGRALFSFRSENRLAKILSTIQPGDYLFIQFGHNDQKDTSDGAGPFTSYKRDLEDYIAKVRGKKALPVLVTPMERRRWSGGTPQETLTDYAAAVRLVGEEQHVPVIDLHAMSLEFYAALGPEGSTKAFVHYPANTFAGQPEALKDDTHHNTYGAYELARCVVEGIRNQVPELAAFLRADVGSFDPSRPDDPAALGIPPSLEVEAAKPEGS